MRAVPVIFVRRTTRPVATAEREPSDPPPLSVDSPPPLVKLTRHPAKWLLNKAQLLVAAVVFAYIGMHIIVAVYYLLFEVNPSMKALWHHTVRNSDFRHNVRDVGEGLLGGLLAQAVVWNHFKKRGPPNGLDRSEMKLHIPNVKDDRRLSFWQALATPELALLYAVPGFFAGLGIDVLIHRNITHLSGLAGSLQPALTTHPQAATLWSKMTAVVTQNWDKKLMGYGAAFLFGRRPAKGVFDDAQLWFVERRISAQKPLRWYHMPTYKARYNYVRRSGGANTDHHGALEASLIFLTFGVGLALAVYGWYILTFIAGQ